MLKIYQNSKIENRLFTTLFVLMVLFFTGSVMAQRPFAKNREELKQRLLRLQQMRNGQGRGNRSGEFKNLSIRERIKKMRELRAKKQNSLANAPVMHLDLSYGQHERQKLDLYAPEKAKELPVIVYFHGGGWQIGNKTMVDDKPQYFTSRNWIFISCNYRLLPDGKHPANVQDVAAALSWIHDNIKQYGGNKDQIVLSGFSAGAHLAAMVAVDSNYLGNCGKSLSIIKAVVILDNPVSDVVAEIKGPSRDRLLKAFGDDPAVYLSASPLHKVSANEKLPVFIMAYSGGLPSSSPMAAKDFKHQATTLADALEKAGAKVYLLPHENLDHGGLNNNFASNSDQENVTAPIMKLLETIL